VRRRVKRAEQLFGDKEEREGKDEKRPRYEGEKIEKIKGAIAFLRQPSSRSPTACR